MTTPTFLSLTDLSGIEWDGVSDDFVCWLKTKITRNPERRRVKCTFAEMDVLLPAFSKIMWHRPYKMAGEPRAVVDTLQRYFKQIPAHFAGPLLMLHEPVPQEQWEGVVKSTTGNRLALATRYGHSYMLYKDLEANATGFLAVFEKCEALNLSEHDAAEVLKHCMATGVLVDHQLNIQASLADARLWAGIELTGRFERAWIEAESARSEPAELPGNIITY